MGLWMLGMGRLGGRVAAPTGLIVATAVGMALIDAGDSLDADAIAHGETVNHEVSSTTAFATYAAAGVGLLVLLGGAGVAASMLWDDEDDDELPTHMGGAPPSPRPSSSGGIDITPGG